MKVDLTDNLSQHTAHTTVLSNSVLEILSVFVHISYVCMCLYVFILHVHVLYVCDMVRMFIPSKSHVEM